MYECMVRNFCFELIGVPVSVLNRWIEKSFFFIFVDQTSLSTVPGSNLPSALVSPGYFRHRFRSNLQSFICLP